jgi:hypothetical protein
MGLEVGDEKTLCCLCCASGTISATFKVPRSGFVSGEQIPFSADIINKSGREIANTTVKIKQRVTYHARGKAKISENTVFKYTREEPIAPGAVSAWNNFLISVPPLPPSQLPNCNIMDIQYMLEVRQMIVLNNKCYFPLSSFLV